MTENTLKKLAQLLEQDQFELIFIRKNTKRRFDFKKRSAAGTGYMFGISDE